VASTVHKGSLAVASQPVVVLQQHADDLAVNGPVLPPPTCSFGSVDGEREALALTASQLLLPAGEVS